MAKLTYRQRLFVAAYLGESAGNAADAARRAGYRWPEKQGPQQLAKTSVRVAVDARLDQASLCANEILARLSDIATADIGDFVKFEAAGGFTLDLERARKSGRTHLIKSLRHTKYGVALELHDAPAALEKLGRYRGLFDHDRIPDAAPTAETDPATARRVLDAATGGDGPSEATPA